MFSSSSFAGIPHAQTSSSFESLFHSFENNNAEPATDPVFVIKYWHNWLLDIKNLNIIFNVQKIDYKNTKVKNDDKNLNTHWNYSKSIRHVSRHSKSKLLDGIKTSQRASSTQQYLKVQRSNAMWVNCRNKYKL